MTMPSSSTATNTTPSSASTSCTDKGTKNDHGHHHHHIHHHHDLPPLPPLPPLELPPLPPLTDLPPELDPHHRHRRGRYAAPAGTSIKCTSTDDDNKFKCSSSKDTPASISTSPTSSSEEHENKHENEHENEHEHQALSDIPPPPPPPPLHPPPSTTDEGTGPSVVSVSPATTVSSESPLRGYSDSTTNTSTVTATAAEVDKDEETESINLLNLASITLASTIIASKIIQKHSKLFSEDTSSSSSSSSSSPSSIHIPKEPLNLQNQNQKHELQGKIPVPAPAPVPIPPPKKNLPESRVKTNGTIVTDADGESQRIITSYIKSISPHVRIVGEESMDEIQKSHLSYEKHTKRHTWWGVSPGSKRRLMKKEESDEDYICEFVKMEVYLRYNMYKSGYVHPVGGGEDEKYNGDNDVDVDDDDDDDVVDAGAGFVGNECEEDEINVDPSRVSIFVDPLDGTSSYAKGDYEAVTILAGIMLDNVPIFGIIVKPFGHEGINANFHKKMTNVTTRDKDNIDITGSHESSGSSNSGNPSLLGFHCPCSALYGGTLVGGAFVVSGSELDRSRVYRTKTSIPQSPFSSPASLANRKAIISKSRGGGVVRQCIDSLSSKGLLHPEPIYITGAGYKTLRLLLGTFDETMWFFPKPGTSLWDVAAADALLRCMGGRISDKFGNDLDYSKSWTDADNLDGIIASSDINLHAKCLELYHDEGWDDE